MGTGFAFDDDEFQGVLRDWRDLREQLKEVKRHYDNLESAASQSLADDVASRMFQDRAKEALRAANASDAAVRLYVELFIAKLEQTAPAYTNPDTATAAGFTRLDAGDPTPR